MRAANAHHDTRSQVLSQTLTLPGTERSITLKSDSGSLEVKNEELTDDAPPQWLPFGGCRVERVKCK